MTGGKAAVAVVYQSHRPGQARLNYALNLAARLGHEACLLVPTDARERRLAADLDLAPLAVREPVLAETKVPVTVCVGESPVLRARLAAYHEVIGVTQEKDEIWDGHDCLYVADEATVCRRPGRPTVFLPFGDSLSSFPAVRRAVNLAAALDGQLVCYHTTWRDPTLADDEPAEHMCTAARAVQEAVQVYASSRGVTPEFIIEMADAVDKGSLRCALRYGANFMVMVRGRRTVKGSYVDEVLTRATMPVLVVNKEM